MLMTGCARADMEPSRHETVNDFTGVAMTVKEGTVFSAGLTVVFENNTDKQYYIYFKKCFMGDCF